MTTAHVVVVKNIKNVMVKMNKKITILSFLLFGCLVGFGQNKNTINVDPEIERMLQRRLSSLDSTNIQGYRIQIFYGNELQQANREEAQFKLKFPEWQSKVYKIYQRPNYRVRVGDFKREIDAQLLLAEVIKHFPNSFIVKGKIHAPDL